MNNPYKINANFYIAAQGLTSKSLWGEEFNSNVRLK